MIGITNSGFGGGGNFAAVIRILYNPGTIVTCTLQSRTLRSDDSGDYLFLVPSAGTWTIAGTDRSGTPKTFQVSVVANDMKTVTFDDIIPPAEREYYREVEYLQFIENTNSAASVPLGMINETTEDWSIKLNKFIPTYSTAPTNHANIIGNSNWSGAGYTIGGANVNKFTIESSSSDSGTPGPTILNGVPYSLKLTIKPTPEGDINNGDSIISLGWARGRLAHQFCVGCSGAFEAAPFGRVYPGKYYSVEITKENTVMGKYIPCVRIKNPDTSAADNMPGYYDVVNNYFYQGVYCTVSAYTPSRATADVITQITAGPYIYS